MVIFHTFFTLNHQTMVEQMPYHLRRLCIYSVRERHSGFRAPRRGILHMRMAETAYIILGGYLVKSGGGGGGGGCNPQSPTGSDAYANAQVTSVGWTSIPWRARHSCACAFLVYACSKRLMAALPRRDGFSGGSRLCKGVAIFEATPS